MTETTRGSSGRTERMIVQCTDCGFQRTAPFEEQTPADIVIEHGRETGHNLEVSPE